MRNCRKVLIALCLLLVLLNSAAYGNTDVQRKLDEKKAEIAEMEKVIQAMNESIRGRESRVIELEKEYAATQKTLSKTKEELVQSEERLREKNRVFGRRVRNAYMKSGLSYLDMIFEADNFGDLILRIVYLSRVLARDGETIVALKEEYAFLRERRAAMEQQQEKLADLRYQMTAENKNLLDQRREVENMLKAARGELALMTPQAERKPVYGVVFDNAPAARPQHGLSQASLVYEYEVEGRITRYLALFSAFPAKVGPVRSARAHSIMLAAENDVRYIHAGGGVDVLPKIREMNVRNTDALRESAKFFRDTSRRAPHNLYINLAALGLERPSPAVTVRPGFLNRQGAPVGSISIEYSGSYRISYEYVPAKGAYRRYINGNLHRDAAGREIAARNIIVQYARHFNDAQGRPTADLVGSGEIDFYSQGQHFRGTWRKDSATSPTRFFYQDGQPIERVYGQTWIQIVRAR